MRKIEVISCLHCSKEFCKADSLQSSRPICSQECLDARVKERVIRYKTTRRVNTLNKCQVCSNPLIKHDSVMTTKYICSEVCRNRYKSERPKKLSILSTDYHIAQGLSTQEAKIKVQQMQRQRSPRCPEYWQLMGYSEEESQQQVSQTQKKFWAANTMSKEERQKITPRSIKYWLEKGLSIEDATLQQKMFNDRSSLSYFVSNLGTELGQRAYQESCQKRTVVNNLQSYINRHGEEQGLEIWQAKYKNRGPDSKLARAFFDQLYQRLPQYIKDQNIYYKGLTEKEFGIRGVNQYYWFDFVISDIKFCIEFNGSYWHADPEIYAPGTVLKMSGKEVLVDDKWKQDREKKQALESQGFIVKTVWCRSKRLPIEQIDLLIKSIIVRYKEYPNEKTQNY